MNKYLTQEEAALVLRCSIHTIARLRQKAGMPWIAGRPILIPEEEFFGWLRQRTVNRTSRIPEKSGSSLGSTPARTWEVWWTDPHRRVYYQK